MKVRSMPVTSAEPVEPTFVTIEPAFVRFGWPDVMRTSLAALYLGGTKWLLQRQAKARGIAPAGKIGREYTWRKSDLDLLLLGPNDEPSAAAKPSHGTATSPRSTTASSTAALERLARIRRGGQP